MKILLIPVAIIIAGCTPLAAQITTDRPAFTDSSIVIPKGDLQFENGFLETGAAGHQGYDFPETLVRYGVLAKTEFRFTAPDYYQNLNNATGLSDLTIGVKQQLGSAHGGFDISLVASLSMPTGAHSVSSHGYDPQLQLPWSKQISANWTAAGMLSLFWPTQGAARNLNGQVTFLFDRQFTKKWDGFIEYAGDFAQRGSPQHLLHFGTACKTANNQQVDLHGGFGLSSAAADHFIGVGYSFSLRFKTYSGGTAN